MINEIEVTSDFHDYGLCVVFRTFSKNDGGQSDEISEPEYYVDGEQMKLSEVSFNLGTAKVTPYLQDMFENYQNYEHTEKEITPQSEWD